MLQLSNLNFLIHIQLVDNDLVDIKATGLPNLQILDLSWNSISTLELTQLESLGNLKRLVLTGNPLKEISENSLSATTLLKNILEIDMSYTKLKHMTSNILNHSETLQTDNM